MLKIKDNVDLKELKKFGFERADTVDIYSRDISDLIRIVILSNKTILLNDIFNEFYGKTKEEQALIKEYIEDLIKADLVEKIDNND